MASIPYPNGIQRLDSFPLDDTSVYDTEALLDAYIAAETNIHEGQIVYVKEGGGVVYKITYDGAFHKVLVGSSISTLDELDDVDTTTTAPVDGHVLVYNNTGSKFVNRVLVEADISNLGPYSSTSHDHDGVYEPLDSNIQDHLATTIANPHSITTLTLSLDQVDNTSDLNKPVSTATQTALDLKINNTEKGTANGVATLGADSKIPTDQLPALAITETYVVADETAQLALPVQEGDVAVRTDENKSYISLNDTNTSMADWQELLTPTDTVLSVNTQTGSVVLNTSHISENTNLYYTEARVSANTDVTANTAKTGITAQQTSDISTNNDKISYPSVDSTKLSNIADNANNYIHPTSAGNKHIPTGGIANQALTYSGSSGTAVWSTLDNANITNNAGYTTNTGTVTSVSAPGSVLSSSGGTTPEITHLDTDGFKHVPANGTGNNGDVLTASATAGLYTWETPSEGSGPMNLDDLTDVTITSVSSDDHLVYSGGEWVNTAVSYEPADGDIQSHIGGDGSDHADVAANTLARTDFNIKTYSNIAGIGLTDASFSPTNWAGNTLILFNALTASNTRVATLSTTIAASAGGGIAYPNLVDSLQLELNDTNNFWRLDISPASTEDSSSSTASGGVNIFEVSPNNGNTYFRGYYDNAWTGFNEAITSAGGQTINGTLSADTFNVNGFTFSKDSSLFSNSESHIWATNGSAGDFGTGAGHLVLEARATAARDIIMVAGNSEVMRVKNSGGVNVNDTLSISKQGDNATLINFITDRGWSFRQLDTGSITKLALVTGDDDKEFYIMSNSEVIGDRNKYIKFKPGDDVSASDSVITVDGNEVSTSALLYDKNTLDLGIPGGIKPTDGAVSINFAPYKKVKVTYISPYASYVVEATLEQLGSSSYYHISGSGQDAASPTTELYVSVARINSAKSTIESVAQGFWFVASGTYADRNSTSSYYISKIEGVM